MADLAKYVVKLQADTAKYMAGLEAAQKKLDRFNQQQTLTLDNISKGFRKLGIAVSAVGFTAYLKQSIDAADAAAKFSQQVGLATETVTGLELGIKMSGASVEQFKTGMLRLSKAAVETAQNTGSQITAFDKLGIAVADTGGKLRSTEDLLRDVADRFAETADGAEKAAVAQELFGRSGASLIPLLNEGSKGLDEIIERSRRLGLVFSSEAAAAAEQFNNNLTLLNGSARGMANQFVIGLLPAINGVTNALITYNGELEAAKELGSLLGFVIQRLAIGVIILADGFETLAKRVGLIGSIAKRAAFLDFDGIQEDLAAFEADVIDRFENLGERINIILGNVSASAQREIDASRAAALASLRNQQEVDNASAALRKQKQSIDAQIASLYEQVFAVGKSKTELALYRLELEGATPAQLAAAKAALQLLEATETSTNAIDAQIAALNLQVDTFGLGASAAALYRLQLEGATDAQLLAAAAAYELLDAKIALAAAEREAQRAASQAEAEAQAQTRQFESVRDGLRNEEEVIRQSYERRRQIIEANTEAGSEAQQELLRRLEEQTEASLEKLKTTSDAMSEFSKAAAANMQSAFADFLFDPFSDGLDGMLKNFTKVLQRMIAEIAASKIFEALGALSGSGGFAGAIGSFFGGARARGGPVASNKAYLVGERGPEMFVPSSSGQIVPGGGGGGVNVQIIDQRGAGAPPVDVEEQMSGFQRMIKVTVRGEVAGMYADGSIDRIQSASGMPVRRRGAR
jgi:hypothetical protein